MTPLTVRFENIPAALADRPQWILWRIEDRNGEPTKVPYSVLGPKASSTDPATWSTLDDARLSYENGGWAGVGYVFSSHDPFIGIDLDGCRDPETGAVDEWAREVVLKLSTYAEISPSETGLKCFCIGMNPCGTGKNVKHPEFPSRGGKAAGVEIYDQGRYFAVTGARVKGPKEPQGNQEAINWFCKKLIPQRVEQKADFHGEDSVLERARKYLVTLPPAISGQAGHNATFHAACVLVLGFGLSKNTAMVLMREYNQTCQPPWSEKDLEHKVDSAAKQPGERNYLRSVPIEKHSSISVPTYHAPPPKPQPKITTVQIASVDYLLRLEQYGTGLISTGFSELDEALAGGVEPGELIVIGARPSHGKSAFALQMVHAWTEMQMPVLIVSEEMAPLAIGKRTVQFASGVHEEKWIYESSKVMDDMAQFYANRATAYIAESCRTVANVVEQIERMVEENGIRAVVIDYAQLLAGRGRDRYEQITNVSIALREVTNKHRLVTVALCQLNREIEKRKEFRPQPSDVKETGQFEQDCDVLMFLVWPHRINSKNDPHSYQIFVYKNRNRAINTPAIECRFEPSRQRIVPLTTADYAQKAKGADGYDPAFESPPVDSRESWEQREF